MRYLGTALMALILAAPVFANSVDLGGEPPTYDPPQAGPVWTEPTDSVVLHNNGPLSTGPCGADSESRLQSTSLGMNVLGFSATAAFRVADNFTVPAGACWDISSVTLFAYQTTAPTNPSPITSVSYQIWLGRPGDGGSVVIFGDTSTNRLTSSAWSRIYRTTETTSCATNRAVHASVCSGGVQLTGGNYWIEWLFVGNPALGGPFNPPVTIVGQCVTGNGRQLTVSSGVWADLIDTLSGCAQDLPFIIEGTQCATPVASSTWGAIKAVYR